MVSRSLGFCIWKSVFVKKMFVSISSIAKAKACVCVYIYITKVLYDEVRFARVHARAYCFSFCSSSECTFPNGIPFTLGSTYSAAISFTSGKKSSS